MEYKYYKKSELLRIVSKNKQLSKVIFKRGDRVVAYHPVNEAFYIGKLNLPQDVIWDFDPNKRSSDHLSPEYIIGHAKNTKWYKKIKLNQLKDFLINNEQVIGVKRANSLIKELSKDKKEKLKEGERYTLLFEDGIKQDQRDTFNKAMDEAYDLLDSVIENPMFRKIFKYRMKLYPIKVTIDNKYAGFYENEKGAVSIYYGMINNIKKLINVIIHEFIHHAFRNPKIKIDLSSFIRKEFPKVFEVDKYSLKDKEKFNKWLTYYFDRNRKKSKSWLDKNLLPLMEKYDVVKGNDWNNIWYGLSTFLEVPTVFLTLLATNKEVSNRWKNFSKELYKNFKRYLLV